MFMFWSKRAVLTRRLLKAKVRGEHETECETQEDTFTRINSSNTNNGSTGTTKTTTTRTTTTRTTSQSKNSTTQPPRSSTGSRGNSVTNKFHQGCCGGDLSHDEDDDFHNNRKEQHQERYLQNNNNNDSEKRLIEETNRLGRCKDLLKSLKENQLEMLLNVVESYGADFGSCLLVARKQKNNRECRLSPVPSDRSSSPGLVNKQESMSPCNRHQRCCGLSSSSLHDNPTRRHISHRHILRSRRHNPGARCSRCVSSHNSTNEELRTTTGSKDEFGSLKDDEDFVENRDNEMNLRIVDVTRIDGPFVNDDPRQEQPAWSPDHNIAMNKNNLPGGSNDIGEEFNEPSRPERDRCRRNYPIFGRATSAAITPSSTGARKRRDSPSIGENSNSESNTESPLDDPHLLSCQIWRWPDLLNSSELKKLPVCHSAKDPVYVCCNPYHWSRLCKPESPPPPYCLIPDRLRPEDCAPSEISGDYRRCGIATSPQPHSGSLTTNGEGGAEMGQKEWCTLAYWELGGRVGRLYPVEPSTVNVFDSLHDGDGLCLATLAENHVASPAVQRTRSKIGLGLMLSQESDGVWAYNRSESPIFVNSPTLDDPESRTLLVYRVPPGFCLNIFDRAKTYQLPSRCHPQNSPMSASFNSGPVDVNSVRISFAKGWGPKYSRQEVTSCPCWLEVLLAPCR